MPTYNVEIADKNNWGETLSTFGKKWVTGQQIDRLWKKITRNERPITYRQGDPK